MKNMTNFIIKYCLQLPLMWALINSLVDAYDMNTLKACFITIGLAILYDIGDYITRDDLK